MRLFFQLHLNRSHIGLKEEGVNDQVVPLEYASIQAATALRYGAKEEDLLKMLTINPAMILRISDRTGSVEKGKDADLVVWSGHPFDARSRVESVYIDGIKIV